MFEIIEKIGEGNRGEVFKVKFNGKIAALKYAKNYEIEKEWEILKYLNGVFVPKLFFKGKKYIIMEYVKGVPLKNLINTADYYTALKEALRGAFFLDEKGVYHKQLGRYYHILYDGENVKFIDFERGVFSKNPRNFLQIIGYYLRRDKYINQEKINKVIKLYSFNKESALKKVLEIINNISL